MRPHLQGAGRQLRASGQQVSTTLASPRYCCCEVWCAYSTGPTVSTSSNSSSCQHQPEALHCIADDQAGIHHSTRRPAFWLVLWHQQHHHHHHPFHLAPTCSPSLPPPAPPPPPAGGRCPPMRGWCCRSTPGCADARGRGQGTARSRGPRCRRDGWGSARWRPPPAGGGRCCDQLVCQGRLLTDALRQRLPVAASIGYDRCLVESWQGSLAVAELFAGACTGWHTHMPHAHAGTCTTIT
jgi:hypothetical protein